MQGEGSHDAGRQIGSSLPAISQQPNEWERTPLYPRAPRRVPRPIAPPKVEQQYQLQRVSSYRHQLPKSPCLTGCSILPIRSTLPFVLGLCPEESPRHPPSIDLPGVPTDNAFPHQHHESLPPSITALNRAVTQIPAIHRQRGQFKNRTKANNMAQLGNPIQPIQPIRLHQTPP